MWTATITQASNVDTSGTMTVLFDVVADDGTRYPNLSTQGTPDQIEANMKSIMAQLKTAVQNAATITVGMEVTL
jgi:hypothetical protein